MTAYSKQAIVFSLNGTLAPNGQTIGTESAALIQRLLSNKKIAIISGCGFPRFETQLLHSFKTSVEKFSNLFLLPASGTKLMIWKGSWVESYSEHLSPEQKEEIMVNLNASLRKVGWIMPQKSFGLIIQDRGSQITFSGLGETAPTELKMTWDPERTLRERIVAELQKKIPSYDIRIGGMTSIDITKRGVNKGYGIRKLEELLKLGPEALLFVGDAIYSGGNDFPVKATGIDCMPVKSATETLELLRTWVVST